MQRRRQTVRHPSGTTLKSRDTKDGVNRGKHDRSVINVGSTARVARCDSSVSIPPDAHASTKAGIALREWACHLLTRNEMLTVPRSYSPFRGYNRTDGGCWRQLQGTPDISCLQVKTKRSCKAALLGYLFYLRKHALALRALNDEDGVGLYRVEYILSYRENKRPERGEGLSGEASHRERMTSKPQTEAKIGREETMILSGAANLHHFPLLRPRSPDSPSFPHPPPPRIRPNVAVRDNCRSTGNNILRTEQLQERARYRWEPGRGRGRTWASIKTIVLSHGAVLQHPSHQALRLRICLLLPNSATCSNANSSTTTTV
jgi:hypothetical protein